jgi:hypothetical protein
MKGVSSRHRDDLPFELVNRAGLGDERIEAGSVRLLAHLGSTISGQCDQPDAIAQLRSHRGGNVVPMMIRKP